jgi:hypothetical protein
MTTLAPTLDKGDRDGTRVQALAGGLALALLVPALALSGLALPLPSAVYRLAVDLIERTDVLAVGFGSSSSETASGSGAIELTQAEPPVQVPSSRVPAGRAGVVAERSRAAAVLPGGRPAAPTRSGTRSPASPAEPSGTGGTSVSPPVVESAPAPTVASTPVAPPSGDSGPDQGQPSASPGGGTTTPAPPTVPKGSTQDPPPAVGETVGGTAGTVGETVETTVGTVGETVGTTVGTVGESVETTVGTVGETVDETVGTVDQTVEETVETVEGILGGLLPKPPKKP